MPVLSTIRISDSCKLISLQIGSVNSTSEWKKISKSFSKEILNIENWDAFGTDLKSHRFRNSELKFKIVIKSEVVTIESIDLIIKAETIDVNEYCSGRPILE